MIHGDAIAAKIKGAIRDEGVLELTPDIGSVNQFLASVDVLNSADQRLKLCALYD